MRCTKDEVSIAENLYYKSMDKLEEAEKELAEAYDHYKTTKEEVLKLEKDFNEKVNSLLDIHDLSHYLFKIVVEAIESENEMIFVEYGDDVLAKEIANDYNFIPHLKNEVERLELEKYIRFNEDDCAITVYGGIDEVMLVNV